MENPENKETPIESLKGSKDPKDGGDNGNPAQSAGRVSAMEQNAHPLPVGDPTKNDPDLMPDSLSKDGKK